MTDQERIMLVEADQRSKNNANKIEDLEKDIKEVASEQKAIYKIATSVEVIAQRITNIEEKVDETYKKVDSQTEAWRETKEELTRQIHDVETQPNAQLAKNVNSVKVAVITSISTALATGVVAAAIAFIK